VECVEKSRCVLRNSGEIGESSFLDTDRLAASKIRLNAENWLQIAPHSDNCTTNP
jgi:hypothetical protein